MFELIISITEQAFCEGCIYNGCDGCMKITAPEISYNENGELEFCSGLTY